MREAYRVFDKERTGYIEAAELKMIFAALPQKLSDREIDEMLRAADEDGEKEIVGGLADTPLPVSKTQHPGVKFKRSHFPRLTYPMLCISHKSFSRLY